MPEFIVHRLSNHQLQAITEARIPTQPVVASAHSIKVDGRDNLKRLLQRLNACGEEIRVPEKGADVFDVHLHYIRVLP